MNRLPMPSVRPQRSVASHPIVWTPLENSVVSVEVSDDPVAVGVARKPRSNVAPVVVVHRMPQHLPIHGRPNRRAVGRYRALRRQYPAEIYVGGSRNRPTLPRRVIAPNGFTPCALSTVMVRVPKSSEAPVLLCAMACSL